MENEIFNPPPPMVDHHHMIVDTVSSQLFSSPFMQSGISDNNSGKHMAASGPLFSTLQEEALNSLYISNHGIIVNDDVEVSRNMSHVGDTLFNCPTGNVNLREQLAGTSLSASSLANLLSASTSFQKNLLSANFASSSALPSEDMRTSVSSDSCNTLNSSLSASVNCRWNCDDMLGPQSPPGRTITTVRPSYHVMGNSEPGWLLDKYTLNFGQPYSFCAASNELSLSLGTCGPSMVNMPTVPDQSSEVSCSGITQVTSKDSRHTEASELQACSRVGLGMEQGSGQTFPSSEELSLYCGSSSPVHFPHVLPGSKYLNVAQQILAEVANFALQYSYEMDNSLVGNEGEARISISSSSSSAKELPTIASEDILLPSGEIRSQGLENCLLQGQETHSKETELLTLLQLVLNLLSRNHLVDRRYNQCLDQIQNVISAFQNATNLGISQMHFRFALHTISSLYKSLRERISAQIFLISQQSGSECMRDKEKNFESSFIQKQWALQQLRRNDQQSWRPQRGLPEKSVSILRAWMFQNFLHPYPKDNEKQLLAIKSGLTRSQVSNWFINARVRLWKPMIEEMYSELNKKNRAEGAGGDQRRHGDIGNQRIHMS